MHNLFVSLPSARGVHPQTMWNVFDMRTELERAGHRLHGSSVYRMPLDLARNEMATIFLTTTCDLNLLLDDDCQVDRDWIVKMMGAMDEGCDILSAPCRMRDHSHGGAQDWSPFNVRPIGEITEVGDLRVDICEWTGLGAVLVKRKVIETLYAADAKYGSRLMPGNLSAAIFNSRVAPAKELLADAPEELNVHMLDDVVFSLKARKAGFKIHAALDVPTVHDGMVGCFGAELDKLENARRLPAGPKLVGPDGRPV
jgi:hypothetical protein